MKFKKTLFVSVLFLIIGIVCICIAYKRYDVEPSIYFRGVFEENKKIIEREDFQSAENLCISTKTQGVELLKSTEDTITIDYFVHQNSQWDIKVENSTLTIQETIKRNFFWINYYHAENPMKIYLPEIIFQSATIDIVNGSFICTEQNQFDSLKIELTNGEITLNNTTVNSLSTNVINGKTKCSQLVAKTQTVFKNVNGSITLASVCSPNIQCKATNGSVLLQDTEAEKYDLSVVTGEIRGTILGNVSDYQIRCEKVIGEIVSPQNSSIEKEKTFLAEVVTGTIAVYFSEN